MRDGSVDARRSPPNPNPSKDEMPMPLHRNAPLLVLTLATLASPGLAHAAVANCMSADGTCEVSNDGFDWLECMCADGSGGGGGGGNEWAGLTELELVPICEEQLAAFCGPFVPPDYVECYGLYGSCTIDNEPEDELECYCIDGTTGMVMGGNAWAGYTDPQLAAECEVQLDAYCVAPPGSVMCSNANGECTLSNMPEDLAACECVGGDYGSFGGGNAWAGLSELELFGECGMQLVSFCGGPLPPPPWTVCSSSLGECTIDNDPEELLECTCADGEMFSGDGGGAWAGLSQDELFMECEVQLFEGCGMAGGSSGSTGPGDGTDTGDASTSEGEGSTGLPGEGSSEGPDQPPPGDSSGGTPPGTTGDDATGDPGETDGGEAGGCGCTSASPSAPHGWALVLLGLVGLRRRRARHPVR